MSALIAGMVVVGALTACGSSTLGAQDGAAGTPDVRTTSGATSTAVPTAACPTADGQQAPTACVPYDGEAAMRENEAYRQRSELPQGVLAKAEKHRLRITVALQKAAKAGSVDQVVAARVLAPLGYDASSVQSYGQSGGPGGLAIGVATDAGCVFGGVRGTKVDLEAGGGIADGGCLPAVGN